MNAGVKVGTLKDCMCMREGGGGGLVQCLLVERRSPSAVEQSATSTENWLILRAVLQAMPGKAI